MWMLTSPRTTSDLGVGKCNKRDTIMSSQSDGGVEDIASRGEPQRGRRLLRELEV